jgi:hypothetical protein
MIKKIRRNGTRSAKRRVFYRSTRFDHRTLLFFVVRDFALLFEEREEGKFNFRGGFPWFCNTLLGV